ncbi:MAG: M23 family metallopeptidase [Nitrospirota bacterium]
MNKIYVKILAMVKISIITLIFILLFIPLSGAIEVTLKPDILKQGDVLVISITAPDGNLQSTFMDKRLHFFKTESGNYIALAGIDMKTTPGEYPLTLFYDNKKIFERYMKISQASFGIQRLTLPKDKVDLTPEILKRVSIEQTRLSALWPVINEKLWKGRFIMPVNSSITSAFGMKRIINKEERSPHSGIDIKADEGTPIAAPNNGRVALIDDQFFGGKTIVIDHGYGIYSIFNHLSKIAVSDGQLVKRGKIIGYTGSTGRATGPNLHWGVRLQRERINPVSLVNLEID